MANRPTRRQSYSNVLHTTTTRDFGGGWDVVDSDLNMTSRFAKVETNLFRALDASLQIRWGTRLFANLASTFTDGSVPTGVEYFNGYLVVTSSTGQVAMIDGEGTISLVWPVDETTNFWYAASHVTFTQSKAHLLLCDGINKPLQIDTSNNCLFLADPATGSNINTPIGSYITTVSEYVCIAGDLKHPDRLHISAKDTYGVFYGDAAPNDATYVDLGAYVPGSDSTIRSISSFRGNLIVGFAGGVIVGQLGNYDDIGNHVPKFTDYIPGHGSICHSSFQSYGDDALFTDTIGVPQLTRTIYLGTLRPSRASQLIDPEIISRLSPLSFASIEDRMFSVYNQREGQYMLFIPNGNTIETTTSTDCFVYTNLPTMDVKAWSLFTGWNFACGCRSQAQRVFFVDYRNRVYVYGTNDDPIYADFVGDTSKEADGTGVAISFDWQLPWADLKQRMAVKKMRHLGIDTKGAGVFNVRLYVDNIITDANGNDAPQLALDFVAGSTIGFGGAADAVEQPYGGGRRTADERLWKFPAKFKLMKIRFSGSVKASVRFVSLSFTYMLGSIRR